MKTKKLLILILIQLFLFQPLSWAGTSELSPHLRISNSIVQATFKNNPTDSQLQQNSDIQTNRELPGLTIAINIRDLGVEILSGGKIIYKNCLEKAEQILPLLKRTFGVSNVYIYDSFYELGKMSTLTHTRKTEDYLTTYNDLGIEERISPIHTGRASVIVKNNYIGKKKTINTSRGQSILDDRNGNSFSLAGMIKKIKNKWKLNINPKLSDSEFPDAKKSAQALKNFLDTSKHLDIKIITDFIPWMAPDAVDETNYKWTFYTEISEAENAQFRSLPGEKEKQKFIENLLAWSGNKSFTAVRITENGLERIILVKRLRFYGIYSADQVVLNPFLPEVQEYYINTLKLLTDAGIGGVRIDLGGILLNKGLKDPEARYLDFVSEEQKQSSEKLHGKPWSEIIAGEEPWKNILSKAKEYARNKNAPLEVLMEIYSYDETEMERVLALGVDKLYYEDVYENYKHLEWGTPEEKANAVNWLYESLEFMIKHKDKLLIFPMSNFDKPSAELLGGPITGMRALSIYTAKAGIKTMVDFRELLGQFGQFFPIPGGIESDGTYSHPFVKDAEAEQRKDFAGTQNALDNSPFLSLINRLFNIQTESGQTIMSLPVLKINPPQKDAHGKLHLSWETDQGIIVRFSIDLNNQGQDSYQVDFFQDNFQQPLKTMHVSSHNNLIQQAI
ncbi:MAG: hypothetical protein GY853_07560 [PVC group bacterium]|nr:hypothetical protein [PVC group bacterium]